MKYAVIYLAVPLAEDPGDEPPNEEDAAAIGEVIYSDVKSASFFEGIELLGTRLTSNNLVAPAINRMF